MRDPSAHPSAEATGEARLAAKECPECGADLLHTNGCVLCGQCGYSPCD